MDKTTESRALAQARQIVQEYQQVLQCIAALLTLGAPETLLPASKDEIRQALRVVARATSCDGLAEPSALDTLRIAYLSLANFVTYEEVMPRRACRRPSTAGTAPYIVTARPRRPWIRHNALSRKPARWPGNSMPT